MNARHLSFRTPILNLTINLSILLKDNDFSEFRNIFEESKKMDKYLSNIPVFLINEKDLGYMGALEVCKNEII